jgi:hypothetical protein
MRATSRFEITSWEGPAWDESDGIVLSQVRVTKSFTGDLEGSSVAQLLTCVTPEGPSAYTAQERFDGTLAGRRGTFVSQHGAATLDGVDWVVAAGTGTGELAGISGTGTIEIAEDGTHTFTLDYNLPT